MKLPELSKRPARAERPSLAAVRPTDLGLGDVAQEADAWDQERRQTQAIEEEVQRAADEETVRPMLDNLKTRFEAQMNEAGALWDGMSPGYARGIHDLYSAETAGFGEDRPLTRGERDALQAGLSGYRESVGQRAIAFESQKRGAVVAEQQAARDSLAVGGVMADYMSRLAEARAPIDRDYDGSQGDYEDRIVGAHDALAGEMIAAAPAHLQARVTQSLAGERLKLLGQAMDVSARGEAAYVAGQARSAGDKLINGVLTAPANYETALAQVDGLVAALPAAARVEERSRLYDGLTEGYVEGLIRDGQHDQAVAALEGGALDDRLKPQTKARLLDAALRARDEPKPEDLIAGVRAEMLARDNLASLAATGVGIDGADPSSLAGDMSPAELARYTVQVEQAKRQFAAMPELTGKTPAEIAAHVESLRPQPGQVGYEDATRAFDNAQRAAKAELDRRAADPAAWGAQAAPTLEQGLSQLGQGGRDQARTTAAAYAAGQMTLQAQAGIAPEQRRVLPKTAATAIVARAEGASDPGDGLRGLAAVLDAFEPPTGATAQQTRDGWANRNRVIAELKAAGADAGDLAAALDLGEDTVRLGRYVSATRGEAFEKMRGTDKTDLVEAVDRALAPFMASWSAVPASRELTEGRRLMAQRLAAERIATRGGSEREAAAEAVDVVAGRYAFVGQTGWRAPRGLAAARVEGSGRPATSYIQAGAARTVQAMGLNGGQGFYTPADNGRGLTAAQRRERYADTVRTQGRWFTTADDRGLALMTPTLEGGWTPALDSEGRPIARGWRELQAAGTDRVSATRTPRYAGRSEQPRGIRNNNPGNIEFRAQNRWRGQTGSDGRFATFATPEDGIRALAVDLGTKSRRGLNTVREILSVYAPPSDNNTEAYIRTVARRMGVEPNAALNLNDARTRASLMGAIIQHENGMQPYSYALIGRVANEAVRR